jgi:hypothetical protein
VVSVSPANGRYGPHLRNKLQVCVDVVGGRYANEGGGCWPAGRLFASNPFAFGVGRGLSAQVASIAGLTSDQVSQLVLFTANGTRVRVPIHDNGFIVEAALADYPLRLVAYDSHSLVIGIATLNPPGQGSSPVRSAAQTPVVNGTWHVVFRTPLATLWQGPSESGGSCTVLLYANERFVPPFCSVERPIPPDAIGGTEISGATNGHQITVQVGSHITRLVIHWKNGHTETIPASDGFAIARLELSSTTSPFQQLRSIQGFDASGHLLATQQIGQTVVGGAGIIKALTSTQITIGAETTCRVTTNSPSLVGYRIRAHVQYTCRQGVLTLIGHTIPNPPWPDRTIREEGTITTFTDSSISIANQLTGTPSKPNPVVTCTLNSGSPSLQGYHRGERVQAFCAHGTLTGINRDTS